MEGVEPQYIFSFPNTKKLEKFRYFVGSKYGKWVKGLFETDKTFARFSLEREAGEEVRIEIAAGAKKFGAEISGTQIGR